MNTRKTLATLTVDDTDRRSQALMEQLLSYNNEVLHLAMDKAPAVRTQAIDLIAESIAPKDGDEGARLTRELVRSFLNERIAYESWVIQKIAGLQLLAECLTDGSCVPAKVGND